MYEGVVCLRIPTSARGRISTGLVVRMLGKDNTSWYPRSHLDHPSTATNRDQCRNADIWDGRCAHRLNDCRSAHQLQVWPRVCWFRDSGAFNTAVRCGTGQHIECPTPICEVGTLRRGRAPVEHDTGETSRFVQARRTYAKAFELLRTAHLSSEDWNCLLWFGSGCVQIVRRWRYRRDCSPIVVLHCHDGEAVPYFFLFSLPNASLLRQCSKLFSVLWIHSSFMWRIVDTSMKGLRFE